jgi:hypothetical protein
MAAPIYLYLALDLAEPLFLTQRDFSTPTLLPHLPSYLLAQEAGLIFSSSSMLVMSLDPQDGR